MVAFNTICLCECMYSSIVMVSCVYGLSCSYVLYGPIGNAALRFKPDCQVMHICKAILLTLFRNNDFDFERSGVLVRHGAEELVVRMKFTTCPQDFLAHCDVFGLKGANGLTPCPMCDNCLGRRQYFEDSSGFTHVLSPMYCLRLKLIGKQYET